MKAENKNLNNFNSLGGDILEDGTGSLDAFQ